MKRGSIKSVLINARALLARRGGWRQGAYAVTRHGTSVDECDPEARCFCSAGAINAASCDLPPALNAGAIKRLHRVVEENFFSIEDWNDNAKRTKSEVLAAFDKAIASSPGRKAA